MNKHQRRKGNLQAASSAKAVRLLQSSGSNIPFVGLEMSSLGLLNAEEDNEMLENTDLAPEFRIVLKKLGKKDPYTRSKAIREMLELMRVSIPDQQKLSFQYFAPVYQRLIADPNNGIRVEANAVLSEYLSLFKRETPSVCLKQTLPFLLFSMSDHSAQVVNSANALMNTCFPGEKKEMVLKNFGEEAIKLAVEIINRKHKLVYSQQFAEEESNEQRQSRLIIQSIKCIDLLVEQQQQSPSSSSAMNLLISNIYNQPSSFNSLMSMGNNVKASAFLLLKRVVQSNPELFINASNKLPSVLLNNLDSSDNSLCLNAFECFIRMAQENKFFEFCSLEKAIVPKFLSMVRKKEGHWDVLATLLLPAFSILVDRLGKTTMNGDEKQFKFAFSILDSFFDGDIQHILLPSWSCTFIEICKYCFNFDRLRNTPSFPNELMLRVNKFTDFIINEPFNRKEQRRLAEFIAWLQAKFKNQTDQVEWIGFSARLEEHLLTLLPRDEELFLSLLDLSPDPEKLCLRLLNTPNLSTHLLLKSILKSSTELFQQLDGLDRIICTQIQNTASFASNQEIPQLIRVLVQILIAKEEIQSLSTLIDFNDTWICFHAINVMLSQQFGQHQQQQFHHSTLFSAICTLFSNAHCLEEHVDGMKEKLELVLEYISEKSIDCERDQLMGILLAKYPNPEEIAHLLTFVLEYLANRHKISISKQQLFAERIFANLLEHPEKELMSLAILRHVQCDSESIRDQLHQFLRSECQFSRVKSVATSCYDILRFKNASFSSLFLPDRTDMIEMATKLDSLYFTELLSREHLLLPFSLLRCCNNQISLHQYPDSELFDYIFEIAKFALFYASQIPHEDDDHSNGMDSGIVAAFNYLFLASTFVNDYKLHTSRSKEFMQLYHYSKELNCHLEKHLSLVDKFADYFLLSLTDDAPLPHQQFPFCALYALINLQQTTTHQSSGKIQHPIQIRNAQLQKILTIAIELRSMNCCELDQLSNLVSDSLLNNGIVDDDDRLEIFHWLTEFEWRSATFTEFNRAEHFVALAQFLEQNRSRTDDWLFMETKDHLKAALNCSLLNFLTKMPAHLTEIDGPIRDFINCALITSLQNCTEILGFVRNQSSCNEHWVWLLGHFSLVLIIRYENCIRLTSSNHDYADIRQEWTEFFGPSVSNYVVNWFLQLPFRSDVPQFFVKSLCNAIHSIETEHLMKSELSDELVRLANDYKDCPIPAYKLFEEYQHQMRSILLATTFLLFDESPEIQFAAANIIKRYFFKLFSTENATIRDTNNAGPSDMKCENEFLYEEESQKEEEEKEQEKLTEKSPPEVRMPRLIRAILSPDEFDTTPCDNKSRVPEINPVLLAWDIVIRFLSDLDVLSRVQYCDALQLKLLSFSLAHLFNSLPDPPGEDLSVFLMNVDDLFAETYHHQLLNRPFNRDHFVCNLYFRTLSTIPALVRDWYNTLGKAEAMAVNRYTQKYVSHLVIRRELQHLENMRRGRLEIRVLSRVREVECVYRLDESAMRLTILLPENYPIGAPKVETSRSIVSKDLERKWLLQLGVFLNRQNGAMQDGLLQWKRSIDQHLKGVEECTICMSTISSANYQLPKIRCRQCRKKFHGDCLYKWFSSSSQSSCPLCRANFV